jgi:hypothetical protein
VSVRRGPSASAAALAALRAPRARLARSVLGQLMRALRARADADLRRAFARPQRDAQRRAFRVAFTGEGANDNGGPYREVFEAVAAELAAREPGREEG